jgi:transcriptional regulator with PAS, ATPase and Fis domain
MKGARLLVSHSPGRGAEEVGIDWSLERVLDHLVTNGSHFTLVKDPSRSDPKGFHLPSFMRGIAQGNKWSAKDPVSWHLLPAGESLPKVEVHQGPELAALGLLRQGEATEGITMFALLDEGGVFSYASIAFREAFPGFHKTGSTLLEDLFPVPRNVNSPEGSGMWGRVLVSEHRQFFGLFISLQGSPGRGVTALFLHEITPLLQEHHRQAIQELDLMSRVMNASADGMMVVDANGIITLINKSFEEIHHVTRSQVIGRHVTEIIENTRMHIVAQTGVAEVDDFQEIGSHDFVVTRFPIFRDGKCIGAVGKIIFTDFTEIKRLGLKVSRLRGQLDAKNRSKSQSRSDTKYTFEDIVAHSKASLQAKERAMRVASSKATILLLGESGVGKEVYAHAIHNLSLRCRQPFIRVNCSAILETLFESELFGYADGAFTGARKGGNSGKFEQADGGTIFLDEVGDMPLGVQAKMLRVLQEHEIDKVGGQGSLPVDVRVIAATNQDLENLVAEGKFRKDLYYRLNVIPLLIPSLRDRPEDVVVLIKRFWGDLQKSHGIYHKSLSDSAMQLLVTHPWPGNIRELRNLLERTLTIVLEDTISAEQVQAILFGLGPSKTSLGEEECCQLDQVVAKAERQAIGFALARSNNNRLQAAKLLGVSRPLLYRKMHEYGLI